MIAGAAPRLLHTMLRTQRLDAMLGFYCGLLGMREWRRIEFAAERYTLIFIGFEASTGAQIELWHDWDRTAPYLPGERYGHLGIGVLQLNAVCEDLRQSGVHITREPGPTRPGGRAIALIEDPDGNEVELLAAD